MAQFVLVKESSMFMDVAERVDDNVTMPVCRVNRHSKGEYNLQLILASPRLRDLLQTIVSDLPNNRDWLDPSIEREAVELLASLKWHDKGSGQPGYRNAK